MYQTKLRTGEEIGVSQKAISLPADILAVMEETREGAMEELNAIGDYNGESESNRIKKKVMIEIIKYLSSEISGITEYSKQKKEILDKMLDGLNIYTKDSTGKNAFMYICLENEYNLAKSLLEIIPEITNVQDNDGNTALMLVTSKHMEEMATLLINYKHDITLRNKAGENATEMAKRCMMPQVRRIHLKLEMTNKFASDLCDIPGFGCKYFELITQGDDIDEALFEGGPSLLHKLSSITGYDDIMLETIRLGADVNLADKDGCTPLLYAINNKQNEKVKILLDAGAEPNATNKSKMSALMFAEIHKSEEIISLIRNHPKYKEAKKPGILTKILKLLDQ